MMAALYSIKSSRSLRSLVRGERGSFTIEASLVFPAVLVALLAMLFMSMYVYQKVVLYHSASLTAGRAAHSWDNSHRDAMSGLAPAGQYDALYWRLHDDHMLDSLFGLVADTEPVRVQLPDGGTSEGGLPTTKLSAAAVFIPEAYGGDLTFEGGLLQRTVTARVRQPIRIAPLEYLIGHSEPQARAAGTVVDPVEFIRSVDLVRYYTAKFGDGADTNAKRSQAAEILRGRAAKGGGKQ
ncbi:TadE/TadG family type IV pilus assembly protein [Paenibacillus sp. 1P07SE]|uniref:TadE/TadG family type IV pilus assembly protein n=1 Tax=Paenibacillus sp. 1P07SE TaxID=3132209 RepID=UPI0039A4DDA4